MKAVILAGGLGTRLSEETVLRPKPMVEIGGRPMLWHIMKIYSHFGINDFIVCCGYKGYMVKEYFANYFLHMADVTFDLQNNGMTVHQSVAEPWKVTLVNTGDGTGTGGRLRRISSYIAAEDAFCMTYGDGVADVDLSRLIAFHRAHGRLATLTAVQPPSRFGALRLREAEVLAFNEKPLGEGGWVNGGFFVLSPKVLDEIESDDVMFEQRPMESLSTRGEVQAFQHRGFWHAMDTLRDRTQLEEMWMQGKAPWKVW